MKASLALSVLLGFAIAAPAPNPEPIDVEQLANLELRQLGGSTSNEFTRGSGCRDVIFFFARGSTEVGNMGTVVGPGVGRGLKSAFGSSNVAVQGIDYAAALATNFLPGGADRAGIAEMNSLIQDAASRCPDSAIIAGGYSQGAALTHRAIEDLPTGVKDKIAGVVTFGDTQNRQDGGQIPNFPKEKVKIFCAAGDLVCSGTLTITAAHLTYGRNTDEAAQFLVGKVRGA